MPEIDITAVSKLKHSELYEAAKKMGGQAALARHLEITPSQLGRWCNLQECPPVDLDKCGPVTKQKWEGGRLQELEQKLFDLTGKTLDELFPKELREAEAFLKSPKTIEQRKTMKTETLLQYAGNTAVRLTYQGADAVAMQNELKERISNAMRCLTNRERRVVELRHGLDGHGARTLDETGEALGGKSRERVRQIEARAIRKMQQVQTTAKLVCFLDSPDYSTAYDQSRERWPSEKYAHED